MAAPTSLPPVNPLSMVGLMLTLASLLGSFFYVQLSQWLRDVQALAAKIELYKFGATDETKKAIRECRIEQVRLSSWHTYVVNVAVIGFVCFILQVGFAMIAMAKTDPVAGLVHFAFSVFQVLFLILAIGLLALGVRLGFKNGRELGKLSKG